jgi:hypothetical protein
MICWTSLIRLPGVAYLPCFRVEIRSVLHPERPLFGLHHCRSWKGAVRFDLSILSYAYDAATSDLRRCVRDTTWSEEVHMSATDSEAGAVGVSNDGHSIDQCLPVFEYAH